MRPGVGRLRLILFGALLGLAWAASLRAYMVEFAGAASQIDWTGTFLQILIPGAVVGALLGLGEYVRRTGGRRGWRWLGAAPTLLAAAPLTSPGALEALITTGIGGGAVAVALIGVCGGYALAGRSPIWARVTAGLPAVALAVGGALAGPLFGAPFEVFEPRGVWVAVLFCSLMSVFAICCSIPFRPVTYSGGATRSDGHPVVELDVHAAHRARDESKVER